MISGLLFDFGGTLDSDGGHWLNRFWDLYPAIGLGDIPRERIKEAFYWADEQAEHHPAMRQADYRTMMELHVGWQFSKLGLRDAAKVKTTAAAFSKPAIRILNRNRHVLEHLSAVGFKMGVLSNFYGNVEVLCREAQFHPYLATVLDSAIVGLRKPDPAFFKRAVDDLKLNPSQIAFIGDSFERDMVPAKALGMTTYWLIGDSTKPPPQPSIVDYVIHSLEDLPARVIVKDPNP